MAMPTREDAVRTRAYQLWEESGCVHGGHEEHWLRAEAECDAPDGGAAPARSDGITASSGLGGEVPAPPTAAASKPRRWPPPVVDI